MLRCVLLAFRYETTCHKIIRVAYNRRQRITTEFLPLIRNYSTDPNHLKSGLLNHISTTDRHLGTRICMAEKGKIRA
jgi:hypothetical protein